MCVFGNLELCNRRKNEGGSSEPSPHPVSELASPTVNATPSSPAIIAPWATRALPVQLVCQFIRGLTEVQTLLHGSTLQAFGICLGMGQTCK